MSTLVSSVDPLNDGSLIAKYEMNGNFLDTTGKTTASGSGISYVANEYGQAMKVLSNKYISTDIDVNIMHPDSGKFSFLCLVKTDANGNAGIFGNSNGTAVWDIHGGFHISAGRVSMSYYEPAGVSRNGSVSTVEAGLVDNSKLHWVGITFNGLNDAKIYIDGEVVPTSLSLAASAWESMEQTPMFIGTWGGYWTNIPSTYAYNNSEMKQLEFYNRVLTPDEMRRLSRQFNSGPRVITQTMRIEAGVSATFNDVRYRGKYNTLSSYLKRGGSVPCESCLKHKEQGATQSGMYPLIIDGVESMAYCDMESDGGGWTLAKRVTIDPSSPDYLTKEKSFLNKVTGKGATKVMWKAFNGKSQSSENEDVPIWSIATFPTGGHTIDSVYAMTERAQTWRISNASRSSSLDFYSITGNVKASSTTHVHIDNGPSSKKADIATFYGCSWDGMASYPTYLLYCYTGYQYGGGYMAQAISNGSQTGVNTISVYEVYYR